MHVLYSGWLLKYWCQLCICVVTYLCCLEGLKGLFSRLVRVARTATCGVETPRPGIQEDTGERSWSLTLRPGREKG